MSTVNATTDVGVASVALAPVTLAPVAESDRIALLDVLRGVALFGIFMVNMPLFALPMMQGFGGPWLVEATPRDRVGWWIITVGFSGKFISMYSLLFGIGFAVMLARAASRGRTITGAYARRLLALTVIGSIHALFIWYGDVLVAYSLVGWGLLLLGGLSAKWLIRIGIVVIICSTLVGTGLGALQGAMIRMAEAADAARAAQTASPIDDASEAPVPSPVVDDSVAEQPDDAVQTPAEPPRGWRAMKVSRGDVFSDVWIEGETRAFRDGPFLDALTFRAVNWGFAIVAGIFGWFWHVFGLFLLGAGLFKAGFFGSSGASARRRCALLVPIGLATEFTLAFIKVREGWQPSVLVGILDGLHFGSAAVLMLGYVGLVSSIVEAFPRSPLWTIIGNAGRMGLTCYIAESAIATFIMYWWGLGMFGQFDLLTLCLLVAGIWAGLVVIANVWFRFFRIGPIEWLWRAATYLEFPKLLRTR